MDVLIRNVRLLGPAGVSRKINIVVEENTIVNVARDTPPPGSKKGLVIEGDRKIALPGLVNAHIHTEETLWMNMIPDTAAHVPWFREHTLPYYRALSEQDSYWSSLLSYTLMLSHGITCCADSANLWPEADADAAVKSGIRALIALWTADLGDDFVHKTSTCLRRLEEHLKKFSKKGRVSAISSVIGTNACSEELYKGALDLARAYGVRVTSHEASGSEDVLGCIERTGRTPVSFLNSIGFLSSRTVLSHVTDVSQEEVRFIKKRGSYVVLCPLTEMKKGKGLHHCGSYAEIVRLGVPLCVATDNANSSNTLDVVKSASVFSLLVKDGLRDPSAFGAKEALASITEDAARVLGVQCGSLRRGRLADIALFDLDSPLLSLGDVYQGFIYGDTPTATDVLVDGEPVVLNGRFTQLKPEPIFKEARARAERIAEKLGVAQ